MWMASRPALDRPFGVAANLGRQINTAADESRPALAADGRSLLFTSNRSGSLGANDLWTCERASPKGQFGRPVNLGPTVNSTADDTRPVLSSDGRVLLFGSKRSGGSGGWDLWMSTRASRNKPFGPPVNLGPNVNSSANDYAPALSADNRLLVFSSGRPGGSGDTDLWMVQLELPAGVSQTTTER